MKLIKISKLPSTTISSFPRYILDVNIFVEQRTLVLLEVLSHILVT